MINTNKNVENYFLLLKNLPLQEKIELIAKISSSLIKEEKNKEKNFFNCFGNLKTKETADELISDIHESRFFHNREIDL